MVIVPTHARKAINRYIEVFAQKKMVRCLFVGVNYQWDSYYRELIPTLVTMDIKKNVIEPDVYGDIEKCPQLTDDSFDGVIVIAVFEWLQDIHSALGEIRRILKKDGRLLFGVPGSSFTTKHPTFTLYDIALKVGNYFKIDEIKITYYRDVFPFYILGIARK